MGIILDTLVAYRALANKDNAKSVAFITITREAMLTIHIVGIPLRDRMR